MQMSNSEIVRRYNAADKKGQIVTILSELNGCKKNDIIDILNAEGVDVPRIGRKPAATKEERKEEVKDMSPIMESVHAVTNKTTTKTQTAPAVVIDLARKEMEKIANDIKEIEEKLMPMERKRAEIEMWLKEVVSE